MEAIDEVLCIQGVCELLRVSESTIKNLRRDNGFPAPIAARWSRRAVLEWLYRQQSSPPEGTEGHQKARFVT